MHLDDGQQPAAVGGVPRCLLDDRDALDGVALAGEPALGDQIGRQHLVLQLVAGGGGDRPAHGGGGGLATREGQPALGEHQYRQLGTWQAFLVPVGHLGVGRQAEAVGAVAGQGEQVGQVADWRECRAAEQFDRHARLEGRQVEFHRLRVARQVDHAEQDLVLVLAHIGEDLAVARFEESDAAAAESLVVLAHREHAPGPVQQ